MITKIIYKSNYLLRNYYFYKTSLKQILKEKKLAV